MRKHFILILFLIYVFTRADAQTDTTYYEKGEFGISATLPSWYFSGSGIGIINLNVKPEIFIANKLSLGTEFGLSLSNTNSKNFYINPALKYYLLKRRLTPIISAGLRYQQYSIEGSYVTYLFPTINTGLSLMNKKGNFYLETGIEAFMRKDGIQANLFPYLRFGFLINRKK